MLRTCGNAITAACRESGSSHDELLQELCLRPRDNMRLRRRSLLMAKLCMQDILLNEGLGKAAEFCNPADDEG